VGKVGLWALGVVKGTVSHGGAGSANSQTANVKQVSGSVTVLGRLIDKLWQDTVRTIINILLLGGERNQGDKSTPNLVEGGEDVVSKLDLGDGGGTHRRKPNSETGNRLLTEGSVEHPVLSCFTGGGATRGEIMKGDPPE